MKKTAMCQVAHSRESNETQTSNPHAADGGRTVAATFGMISREAIFASNWHCRFSQKSGVVLKYIANRAAVSRVITRRPRTISFTRPGGTDNARASAFCVSLIGLRNSSNKTSPGVMRDKFCFIGTFQSVIVDNFYVERIARNPDKTDPPLIVYTDAVLPCAVASQRFQTIPGWASQVY